MCLFAPLESLNLYHNCIKCIPEAIINLQMLTYLDIRWAAAKRRLCLAPVCLCPNSTSWEEVLVPHFRPQTENLNMTHISLFAETLFPVIRYSLLHVQSCLTNVGQRLIFLHSRNLLSVLPKYLFNLPLKVLLVSNNKLVSIPEEIGKAKDLMELVRKCVIYENTHLCSSGLPNPICLALSPPAGYQL